MQHGNKRIRRNTAGNGGVMRGKNRENADRVVANTGIRIHNGMEKRCKLIRAPWGVACNPRRSDSILG
jgi:hypothetical protein